MGASIASPPKPAGTERVLQRMPGHRDVGSARRYAVLTEEALIYALKDREVTPIAAAACPSGELGDKIHNKNNMLLVESAGIEPGARKRRRPKRKKSTD
jgi:hypothetical protein